MYYPTHVVTKINNQYSYYCYYLIYIEKCIQFFIFDYCLMLKIRHNWIKLCVIILFSVFSIKQNSYMFILCLLKNISSAILRDFSSV